MFHFDCMDIVYKEHKEAFDSLIKMADDILSSCQDELESLYLTPILDFDVPEDVFSLIKTSIESCQ